MTCYTSLEYFAAFSTHAYKRKSQRGFSDENVAHILRFGRKSYYKSAIYYSIGRKEIKRFASICPALKNMNGMHLVMINDIIITMFRNCDFRILKSK